LNKHWIYFKVSTSLVKLQFRKTTNMFLHKTVTKKSDIRYEIITVKLF